MGNRGWDSMQGGDTWSSNERTTGRKSGAGNADSFIRPADTASIGNKNDPLDQRSDLFESPGQLSITETHQT